MRKMKFILTMLLAKKWELPHSKARQGELDERTD